MLIYLGIMNPKELIAGTIIIAILILGFYFILKSRSTGKTTVEGEEAMLQTPQETIDNAGFEKRAQDTSTPPAQAQKQQPTQKNPANQPKNAVVIEKPEMQLRKNTDYKAVLTTSMGVIKIDLFEKLSPWTVNNFVYLAKKGFYNGTIFHRVINDFMIQGGDPTGTGMGGPGYSFDDEINEEKLVKGSFAMANSGKDTNGSQFFIVTKKNTPWLDRKHTNFGMVYEGLDVADEIQKVQTDQNDKPLKPVTLISVEILEEKVQEEK